MNYHIVGKGESLWLIAKKHHVTLQDLIDANPQITDPNNIMIGEKIFLPTDGGIVRPPRPVRPVRPPRPVAPAPGRPETLPSFPDSGILPGFPDRPGTLPSFPDHSGTLPGFPDRPQHIPSFPNTPATPGIDANRPQTLPSFPDMNMPATPEVGSDSPQTIPSFPDRPANRPPRPQPRVNINVTDNVESIPTPPIAPEGGKPVAPGPDMDNDGNNNNENCPLNDELCRKLAALPRPLIYVVRDGDNLYRIAQCFEISLNELLSVNSQITNPDMIHSGDKIFIPRPRGVIMPRETMPMGRRQSASTNQQKICPNCGTVIR